MACVHSKHDDQDDDITVFQDLAELNHHALIIHILVRMHGFILVNNPVAGNVELMV